MPFLALEVGAGQAGRRSPLLDGRQVEIVRDFAGHERVVVGRRLTSRPASPRAASRCSRPTPSTGSRATPRAARRSSGCTRSRGEPPDKPSAVMFFDAGLALAALPELGSRTRALMGRLLPGGVTLVLPNPRGRYPLAGGDALGLRVPDVPLLRGVGRPVLQSSANVAGGPDARRIEEVPSAIRAGADLVLDAGRAPRDAVDGRRPPALRGVRRVVGPSRGRRALRGDRRAARMSSRPRIPRSS